MSNHFACPNCKKEIYVSSSTPPGKPTEITSALQEKLKAIKVDSLSNDLPIRIINSLLNAGCSDLYEVTKRSRRQFFRTKNLGRKSVSLLEKFLLDKYGVILREGSYDKIKQKWDDYVPEGGNRYAPL